MSDIPVRALRRETRNLLSSLLNPEKIIPTVQGLPRDWQGLAELCKIKGEQIPSIQRSDDPTAKVLELWCEKTNPESTIENLINFLQNLDRFDVLDDITPLLEKDTEYYIANPNGYPIDAVEFEDDSNILTYDDAERQKQGLSLQIYDAFILFDDDDIAFATDIVIKLETQYNLSLCVKDRDMVGGHLKHDSVIRLISTRCKRVIVVFSSAFLESPTNKYFCSLAQLEGIENCYRKIIPCLYKPCTLPLELRAYHLLNFNRSEKLFGNFWDQLFKSIKGATPLPKAIPIANQSTRVPICANDVPVQIKSLSTTKPMNHVKFSNLESPIEEEESETAEEEPKEESISTSNSPESLESFQGELKKKPSFYKKFKKIIHPKTKKDCTVVQKEKKWFWQKSSKIKLAVAN
ncbi:unnamed protein product [Phaedon cochleariae]|uniref:Myeloid differentiation primary response protein MyD88 n=1 Tax=Phaedon cochleariae TaxID=80249 RepID=A0A9N9SHK3_PHACE|nr:unnamed protein product [Phaedon cochleariae]